MCTGCPIVKKRMLKCPLVWLNTLNCPLGWLKHDKLPSWVAKTCAKVPSSVARTRCMCPSFLFAPPFKMSVHATATQSKTVLTSKLSMSNQIKYISFITITAPQRASQTAQWTTSSVLRPSIPCSRCRLYEITVCKLHLQKIWYKFHYMLLLISVLIHQATERAEALPSGALACPASSYLFFFPPYLGVLTNNTLSSWCVSDGVNGGAHGYICTLDSTWLMVISTVVQSGLLWLWRCFKTISQL